MTDTDIHPHPEGNWCDCTDGLHGEEPTKDERWACPECGRRMASAYKHICPPGHAKDERQRRYFAAAAAALRERAYRQGIPLPTDTQRPTVACPSCGGHGLVGSLYCGATECPECDGAGIFVVYPNDALAAYPGGPMHGSWPGKYAELTGGAA